MEKNKIGNSKIGMLAISDTIYAAYYDLTGNPLELNSNFKSLWENHSEQLHSFVENCILNISHSTTSSTQLHDGILINWQIEKTDEGIICIGIAQQKELTIRPEVHQLGGKLKAILDHTVDSHLLIDLNKRVVAFNRVAKEEFTSYYNQSIEEGALIDDILPNPNLEIFNREFKKVLQGKPSILELNRIINDEIRWFSIAYSPVYNDSNQVIGVSKTTRDITQLRETEHKLQKQEEILDAIYQSTRESCTFIDNDLKIQYINQKGQDLIFEYFGKNASVGDSIMRFVLPTYRKIYQNHYRNALSGQSISFEINDKNRWWEFELFPVYNQAKEIIGIAQNLQIITERKQKELETVRQNEFLKQINWQFSHEIRRPVASILGLCDLLKNHTSNSEEVKQFIDGILESSSELDEIIHKIVHLANAEDLNQN